MHIKMLVTSALGAALTFAQTSNTNQDRVFKFVYASSPQQMQEIATVIRAIGEIRQVSVDTSKAEMTVHGTPDQIGLAGWIFNEFDKPGNQQPPQSQTGPVVEYDMPAGPDNVVRIFYVPNTQTIQAFQEVVTAVRSTTNILRMFTYNAPRGVAARGTADQIALAEWLFGELGKPAVETSNAYRMPGGNDDLVQVFHLSQPKTIQEIQEVATLVRSIADIRYLFTYNTTRAFAARATADQIALADWLVKQLDVPAHDAASNPYRMATGNENVVRVFYLTNAGTVQEFQQMAVSLRAKTEIRRAFTYNTPRALALRGTAAQLDLAAQLIADQTKN
jgi:hypothetical protein